MSRRLKYVLIAVLVVFVLLLSSMLIVPWQVKKQGTRWIAENTERKLTIEKVFFNPFTLSLEISAANLSEANSSDPFVSFSRFLVSVSVRSIIDQALVIDHLEIDDPYVNIALVEQGKFNFSDFIPADSPPQENDTPEEEPKPFYFAINNIIINNGAVDFSEQVSANPAHHEIRQLSLAMPFIGNIPKLTNDYVTPRLFMLVNGSELKMTGQLKPFHDSLETELYVSFNSIQLPFYANNSPVPLPVKVKDGSLDFEIDLSYIIATDKHPQLKIGGQFAISDLNIQEPDGSELLQLPTLLLGLREADVFKQEIAVENLEIYEPQIYIDRDQDGQLNLLTLTATTAPTNNDELVAPEAEPTNNTPDAEPDETAQALLLLVEHIKLEDGQVHFRDDSVTGGLSEEIKNIEINIDNLSTHPEQQADMSFTFNTDRNVNFNLSGQLGLTPVKAALDINLNELPLEAYYPYLQTQLTAPVEGQLSLWGKVHYTPDNNVTLADGLISLNNLIVPFGDEDKLTLAALQLRDSAFDLQKQQVNLGTLTLKDGVIKVSKLADGSLSPLQLLQQPQDKSSEQEQPQTQDASDTSPWQLNLVSLDLVNFNAAFTDYSQQRKPAANINKLNLHVENINYPEAQESPFSLSFAPGKHGTVHTQGTLIHTPLKLDSEVQIADVALNDYDNFIPDNLALSLRSGRLFTNLAITLQQNNEEFQGTFSGTTDLNNFNLRDRRQNDELVNWQGLNIKGIKGQLAPFALHIEDIALSEYAANIEISPDGQVNLATLNTPSEIQEEAPEQEAIPEETPTNESEEPADISIKTVTLQGGTVRFTDRHLPSTFSTTMHQLGGRVSGLSSDQNMQADVDLRGNLENHSPLTIQGAINPLSEDLFADLTITFNDIDLTPMTPYSGTYLGYVIDKGKLYLDLNYTIKHRHITAANKVLIDQFTFGDSVKSDKATSLPVSLAIALLKNRNDEIRLNIPVSGDLDDPSFSLAGTIFTVLRNLLVKAATSPFSLLAAAFGGDEDFSSVTFAPGETALAPEQQKKLAELAEVLYKRPGLTLEISTFADREKDPEAYRQQHLQQQLLDIKQREIELKNTAIDATQQDAVSTEEYPQLITFAYKEASFPRPRTNLGTLKELPVEEMEKLLLSNIIAGDEQLSQLAQQRAMTVRDELEVLKPELKPRLFLKKNDIYKKPDEGPASRVEFSISAK